LNKFEARVILALFFEMNKSVKDELAQIVSLIVSILPFCIGAVVSQLILPENCSLFGNAEGPFSCDSIPNTCCGDKMTVSYAQIIFILGIGLTVAACIICMKNESQNNPGSLLKIFD
jgi:heme/copper-type cytochrome/quinol oxidase subunit 4